MGEVVKRLGYLILGWLSVGVVYYGSVYLQQDPILLGYSLVDKSIPFTEHAVWPYLSFFLIIPYCFLSAPYSNIRWMSFSFIGCGLIAGICFVTYPTMVDFAATPPISVSSFLYHKVLISDVNVNCLPSLHVALTVVAIWGAVNFSHKLRSLGLVLWGILICLSIIQLRRHVFIDLVAGLMLAWVVGYGMRMWLNYVNQN